MAEMRDLFLLRKPWDQRSETFRRYERVKQMCNSRWNFENYAGKWEQEPGFAATMAKDHSAM